MKRWSLMQEFNKEEFNSVQNIKFYKSMWNARPQMQRANFICITVKSLRNLFNGT